MSLKYLNRFRHKTAKYRNLRLALIPQGAHAHPKAPAGAGGTGGARDPHTVLWRLLPARAQALPGGVCKLLGLFQPDVHFVRGQGFIGITSWHVKAIRAIHIKSVCCGRQVFNITIEAQQKQLTHALDDMEYESVLTNSRGHRNQSLGSSSTRGYSMNRSRFSVF
jgi:hypothetical protein